MTDSPTLPPDSVDWGIGRYERTAAELRPAAEAVIAAASPQPGERLLDIGCGTGNAVLLAAERGALVTGVDPAARLLEVARGRARASGLQAEFMEGHAGRLPVEDGSVDVAVSVFGIIFSNDPPAAAAELARVCSPGARILISAWVPGNGISRAVGVSREAVGRALGNTTPPTPFSWHKQEALAGLLAPHGYGVSIEEHRIAFTGSSPRAYLEEESAAHPLAVASGELLDRSGEAQAVRERMLEIYEEANEDPDGFRITSTYIIATARRVGARPATYRP
jgi:SAM-dependent methyltransferase